MTTTTTMMMMIRRSLSAAAASSGPSVERLNEALKKTFTFYHRNQPGLSGASVSSTDLLAAPNSKVVVLAVPGAFTPVCSSKHVPSFLQRMEDLKKKGVTSVVVYSVNDSFVMDAWRQSIAQTQNNPSVVFVADPAGEFAKAAGLDVDLSKAGLGIRSQRSSMLIENGKVKALTVENSPGDFDKTSVENILKALP